MLKTVAGRYVLFAVLGVEALTLPYFLPKEAYGEVEFLKFTGFLFQFALFGAGTGYVVRYLKTDPEGLAPLTMGFLKWGCIHAILIGAGVLFVKSWTIAILSMLAIIAMILESMVKVRERYLLAMAFKPILSATLIAALPVVLIGGLPIEDYVVAAFAVATTLYGYICVRVGLRGRHDKAFRLTAGDPGINNYGRNISSGFLINASTAITFLFFYVDRTLVRDWFPDRLADYSLSYAIMQLTVVAITTFSYVNVVEFGKDHVEPGVLKAKVYKALKHCMAFYLVFGGASIAFAYGAESFYGYDSVFETTSLMVGLFGLANVLASLNAAHLYLGSIRMMALLAAVTFIISLAANTLIGPDLRDGYFILLGKTYGLYLVFAILSFLYIYRQLARPEET